MLAVTGKYISEYYTKKRRWYYSDECGFQIQLLVALTYPIRIEYILKYIDLLIKITVKKSQIK